MIDIEQISKNAEKFRTAIRNKRVPLDLDRLLAVEIERREATNNVNRLRERRNRLSELVVTDEANREQHVGESRRNGEELADAQKIMQQVETEYVALMSLVPSLPAEGVPEGETDKDNLEIRRWSEPARLNFQAKDHLELAKLHAMLDLDGARNIAGSRAYALKGTGALLEMALLRFALEHVVDKGFTPVLPPLMVNGDAMFGTGYFPLGEDNAYEMKDGKLFLTGTSEVGIVSMHKDRVFNLDELPVRFVGTSTCFRREAGAAGRDTRGLYRVHQFQKVEQVVFCENDPQTAKIEHLALLQNAEEILQALELPYRVVAVCTGDMGLGQVEKHDIETWMPSRAAYCETHSCSTFHDFQTRRLNIRYRDADKKKRYAYTLNNTALASPRILIPYLENHQLSDGTIYVPPALRPYLGNRELLEPR